VGERMESYLEQILDKTTALEASARAADTCCQRFEDELITVENKELKSCSSRRFSGIGIKIVLKGAVDYAFTSDLSQSGAWRFLPRIPSLLYF